jgi:TonB family protein
LGTSAKSLTCVVELRTSTGALYAQPSFWERLYLLWMFRNFRCLPREVLGVHQRRLIDRLSTVAVRERSVARERVIGIVENVQLPKAALAQTASNLVEMAGSVAEVATPRTLVAGGSPITWQPIVDPPRDARTPAPTVKVENISSRRQRLPRKNKNDNLQAFSAWMLSKRLALIVAGAALAMAVVMFVAFRMRSRHLVDDTVSSSTSQFALPTLDNPSESATPAHQSALLPTATTVPAPTSALQTKPLDQPFAQQKREPTRSVIRAAVPEVSSIRNDVPVSEPQLQVAQPPVSGFELPIAPSSNTAGKVNLRAVIGTDGRVTRVDVLSGNPTLAAAAVRAVRRWHYAAPELDGHAVEAETRIAINFVGDDAVSVSFPSVR